MEQWFNQQLEKGREYRRKRLSEIANFLAKIGFTAHRLTLLSLLAGIGAAYFLLQNNLLYILLALLHLTADALDGVLASLEMKPSRWGKYFDSGTDAFITLLVLGKVAFFLKDYYAFIVVALFALAQIIYFASKMQAPVLQFRTVTVLLLMLTFPANPWSAQLLLLVMGLAGVSSFYSLGKQVQWYAQRAWPGTP